MFWFVKISNKYNKEDLLFHGSGEPIDGPLVARSWGGILWVGETPDVAQNYIPTSGSSIIVHIPTYKDNFTFRPDKGFNLDLLNLMGYYPKDIKWDHIGQAISYSVDGKGLPTHREVRNYVENVLGYKKDRNGAYHIREDDNGNIAPASYKLKGTLFIIIGKSKLKLYDMTGGTNDDDLMDPTYNKIHLFKRIEKEGYDGVIINDFAQSKMWGNVGHRSIGIFPSGLAKLKIENTPASNFDWGDSLDAVDTEEFKQWLERQGEDNVV